MSAGELEAAIEMLRKSGHVYESEGALWLRTTEFGDDKDRVLVRSDGEPTYFAPDIAYHYDKLKRGAEHADRRARGRPPRVRPEDAGGARRPRRGPRPLRGADHPDGPPASSAVSGPRCRSGRATFVTLDELIDDIGTDATRFFMLQRSHETTVDLDLDLARRQSQDNPVYYVQYAHARIASILRKARAEGAAPAGDGDGVDEEAVAAAAADALGAAAEPSERALVQRLLELPNEVRTAGERRAAHRSAAYATATAADFHAFYRDCQVVGAPEWPPGGAPRPGDRRQTRHRQDARPAGGQRARADVIGAPGRASYIPRRLTTTGTVRSMSLRSPQYGPVRDVEIVELDHLLERDAGGARGPASSR